MNTGKPTQDVEVLRKHIAALSGTILRVNATLDVTTVLQEIVDNARVLTGSRYGVITTIDGAERAAWRGAVSQRVRIPFGDCCSSRSCWTT